ncbi:hypothetical protein Y032_0011g1581 [Ancylostoma ceylanicum]|uniref:Uncharacterized protein n=1 Tax=Ancylostoma ceylanicum TaxID=53326 RepID=A0A016VHB7_9BILA|nr:hypothetical protein Y032_0011g1581 [Ancylostoma ceylanicum]
MGTSESSGNGRNQYAVLEISKRGVDIRPSKRCHCIASPPPGQVEEEMQYSGHYDYVGNTSRRRRKTREKKGKTK